MFIYSYVDSKKRTAETALHGAFSEGNLLQKDFTVGFYFLTVFQNFLHHVFLRGYALRHPPSYLHSLHSPRQFYNSSSSFHSFLSFTIIQLSNRLIVVSILSQLLPRSMGLTESLPNRSNLFPFGQKQFLNFAPLAPCFLDCGLL